MASIAINYPPGVSERKSFQEAGSRFGMEMVYWDVFDWGTVDFSPILLKTIAKDVEVILLSSAPPDSAGHIVKQAREIGYDGYFLCIMSDIAVVSEIAGAENTEGKVISVGELGLPVPEAAWYYAGAYVEKYGPPLSVATVIPWLQSVEPLFFAIEQTQSLDSEVVAEAVRTGRFPTVGGETWFGGGDFYGIDNQMQGTLPVSIAQGGMPVIIDWAVTLPYPANIEVITDIE